MNMEPENHLFKEEYHLNQNFIFGFKTLIFREDIRSKPEMDRLEQITCSGLFSNILDQP